MEHLVESHLGGYYVSNSEPEVIEEYCEQCGDHDRIIISWEEGKHLEALLDYFSDIKMSYEEIENDKIKSLSDTEELIDYLTFKYDDDRYLIYVLTDDKTITLEEQKILLKQVTISQKEQFKLLKNVYYPNGFVRIKKR